MNKNAPGCRKISPKTLRQPFFLEKFLFFSKKSLDICNNWCILGNIRGVVAKRSGSGLQNRINRFDSDPRLHFCALISKNASFPQSYQPNWKSEKGERSNV